jgi:mycofactocin system transcriptional regulator
VSSPEEIEGVAMRLFTRHGFADTTVEEIAAAASISRRTFFRYFGSKNDVVWGHFDVGLEHLREALDATDPTVPWPDALAAAVVDFNRFSPEQEPVHRERMELILHVPALQAYSTLMYAQWRDVVTDFVARRLELRSDDFVPRLVGHLALAAAVAAYEQWLTEPGSDLASLLADGLRWLDAGHE